MSNITGELKAIWAGNSFKAGNNAFWLYNYSFFKLLDEKLFKEYNVNPSFPGKLNIATGSTNPDDDEYGLYVDITTGEIFIYAYYRAWNKRGLKRIAGSLAELFGTADIASVLVSKDDPGIWQWTDELYNGADENRPVAKGVLPFVDLRYYFRQILRDTVIIHPRGFNIDTLKNYFNEQGAGAYFPADFSDNYFGRDDWYIALVEHINAAIGNKQFFSGEFHSSGQYGFGNYAVLSEVEQQQLDYYGLIAPKA
jgi:hypothetical protein